MISRHTFRRSIGLSLLAATFLSPFAARADVKMPLIFGDHMVLQQQMKIPVWGWAAPGEDVTVTLGSDSAKTKADAEGKWRVDLKALPTDAKPQTLTVKGKNNLKFDDVLVGEVWVCSGQSNMEFGMRSVHNAATEVPKATDNQLRLFHVKNAIAQTPQSDLSGGKWEVCSPEAVGTFTAVGYFFGKELRQSLNRPVGLIESSWGGMPAQAYTSLSGLQKDPPFKGYIDAFNKVVADTPKAKAEYPKALEEYQAKLKEWNETVGKTWEADVKKWTDENVQTRAEGKPPLTAKPTPSAPRPKEPNKPEGGPNTPTVLYNANIAPLIPYAIRGAIWYQGESNAGNGLEYRTLFPRMISDWREKWNEGDFPFLFVQLANFQAPQVKPSEGGWALLREAQLMTLSLPNTGMASAIDLGNGKDIHPTDKMDVGLRLAQSAKKVAYQQNVVPSGPLYDSMTIEGNKIRILFKESGSGLQMGVPPWMADGSTPPTPTELKGFAIAGADQNFVWAKATIDGATVVVSADEITSPVSVRYDWASNPAGNLYNKEGLPASPFRTDNWVEAPPAPKPATPPAAPAAPAPAPAK